MALNRVAMIAVVLVVLAVSGILVGTSQGDVADTTSEGVDDAQCDTWAKQSTTAGNPDEADEAEQKYNENCEGNLDDLADSSDFIGGGYNPDDHEDDEIVDGDNPEVSPRDDDGHPDSGICHHQNTA